MWSVNGSCTLQFLAKITELLPIEYIILLPIIIALDLFFGEPVRWHPLVAFGKLAGRAEKLFNTALEPFEAFVQGAVAWLLIVLPLVLFSWVLVLSFGWPMEVLIGVLAVGGKSLKEHAFAVKDALLVGNLDLAQEYTARMVSRDTSASSEEALSRATIESVLENASDAIFAPLFWFVVGGAPAVVLYRLANTLDTMWGYKNDRFLCFGKFTARTDDVLNYIPARLTAMTWVIVGDHQSAVHCWRTQASTWYSPNAGVVMAVGAGALRVKLGGNALYEGEIKQRPKLGLGEDPIAYDIERAWKLVSKGLVLWSVVALLFWLIA